MLSLLYIIIVVIRDRLEPFVGSVLTWDFNRDMAKPRVRLGAVPVFDVGGDDGDVTWGEFLHWFAFFLVLTIPCYTE